MYYCTWQSRMSAMTYFKLNGFWCYSRGYSESCTPGGCTATPFQTRSKSNANRTMTGIRAYKMLMIRRKRSNATAFFLFIENLILAEMIIKSSKYFVGTLDFVSAMFFFCKYHLLFDDQTRAFDWVWKSNVQCCLIQILVRFHVSTLGAKRKCV